MKSVVEAIKKLNLKDEPDTLSALMLKRKDEEAELYDEEAGLGDVMHLMLVAERLEEEFADSWDEEDLANIESIYVCIYDKWSGLDYKKQIPDYVFVRTDMDDDEFPSSGKSLTEAMEELMENHDFPITITKIDNVKLAMTYVVFL